MPHPTSAYFLAALDHLPAIKICRERAPFTVTATVETDEKVGFNEACCWALQTGADAQHLRGLARPRVPFPEATRILWEFEFDDDAMLFALRFGGTVRGPIDVGQWRQSVLGQL